MNYIKKKIKKKYINYSHLLFDNMSFSLNKNKNEFGNNGYKNGNGYMFTNKNNLNNFYKINTINNDNKKKNLSSLPNLLCNNYMNMHNFTISTNDLYNINYKNKKNAFKCSKNKSSYQNIFEQKKVNPNYIKIRNIDYKSYNNKSNINKKIIVNKFNEKEENKCNNQYKINKQLNNIHIGVKSLLDGLYNIYLNASKNEKNFI